MTAPTPAAVRAAMKTGTELLTEEEGNALRGDLRFFEAILRDHIRAIAAEMREVIPHGSKVTMSAAVHASVLNAFADKLEGRES